MQPPPETTLEDTRPVLADEAPMISLGEEPAGEHGAPAAEHGAPAEPLPPDPVARPAEETTATQAACPAGRPRGSAVGRGADCVPVPLNEHGDAVAMEVNSEGMLVPVAGDAASQGALVTRLGERRDELDAREKELEMRLALVEAAEKRIEERTAALKALEARISALVDERKSDEDEQFGGIVRSCTALMKLQGSGGNPRRAPTLRYRYAYARAIEPHSSGTRSSHAW